VGRVLRGVRDKEVDRLSQSEHTLVSGLATNKGKIVTFPHVRTLIEYLDEVLKQQEAAAD